MVIYQPVKNKYYQWYQSLVLKAKNRKLDSAVYKESHHIIPKCLGGDNSESNLIELTLREHYIAHLLLSKMYEGEAKRKMYYGLWMMLLQGKKRGSRVFEMYREKYIEVSLKTQIVTDETRRKISERTTGVPKTKTEKLMNLHKSMVDKMTGSGNPMYGLKQSEDTKKLISEANKGKKRTEEQKQKMSERFKGRKLPPGTHFGEKNPMFGKKHSEETRRKISEAGKRRHFQKDINRT
jgi:hypothetical protein